MKTIPILPACTAAVFLSLTAPSFSQTMGTAHPEDLHDDITTSPAHYAKLSPAVPMPATTVAPTPSSTLIARNATAPAPVTAQPAPLEIASVRHVESASIVADDDNSGVIVEVPSGPNELPIGTLLRGRLQAVISTKDTLAGSRFSAILTTDIEKHGKVLLPAGSIVGGRIAQIHGGRRIGGAAAIRLQPDTVTLPDGTLYHLDADVIDLDKFQDAHVNSEGSIIGNEHPKATLAALGLTTGSAAVAGAMVGGGFGAVVGAGIGAGVGTIWWLKRDRQQTLAENTEIVFSLGRPLQLSLESH